MKTILFLSTILLAAPLLNVRVFYRADGTFLAKYVRIEQAPKQPDWAIGYCDISPDKWNEKTAQGNKRIDPTTCTFCDAPESEPEKRRRQTFEVARSTAPAQVRIDALLKLLGLDKDWQ